MRAYQAPSAGFACGSTRRRVVGLALLGLLGATATARADALGGFSADEERYLSDRNCCAPLEVVGGKAKGMPSCRETTDELIAKRKFRGGKAQKGAKATHVATARGTVITIALKDGGAVVEWDAKDPVSSIETLTLSDRGALAAVEYTVRVGGRAMSRVVGFQLAAPDVVAGDDDDDDGGGKPGPGNGKVDVDGGTPAPAETPEVTKALAAARKAAKDSAKKALEAWQKVLALDAEHPEAIYGVAVAQAKQKQPADAIASIEQLGALTRDDAVIWIVEARFDKAFAGLRDDPKFRAAARLDGEPRTVYEQLVGMGGVWEQPLIACDTPKVTLTLGRTTKRDFKVIMISRCQGDEEENQFGGTWAPVAGGVQLTFPNIDVDEEVTVCPIQTSGDELGLSCQLDDFVWDLKVVRR